MVRCHRLVLMGLLSAAGLLAGDASPASYTIETVAGSNDSGDGGSALAAVLGQPEGVVTDRSGNVYFAEAANHRVRKVDTAGSIHTVAGTGVAGFAGDGGPGADAQLNQPYGLAIDTSGVIYIADLGNARVRKLALDGTIQTVAGGGTLSAASAGQGGPATSAQLVQPRNVAIGPDGSLYISDFGANQVYRVSTSGMLSLVAGTGAAGFSGVGTSAISAQLNAPAGLAVDPSGAVYFADSSNNRVRKVYNGLIITVFNTPVPTGVALDSSGMLYIAASNYFGTVVQSIGGISSARDITVDSTGNVFATSGGYVMKLPSGGKVTPIAGSGSSQYFGGDGGPATSAQLFSPSGIVADSSGNWYIADTSNNRIRMVTPAGVISTIAGTGSAGSSGDNGPAKAAELNSPRGMAIDSSNNLYIADSGNNEIRKITPGGAISSIASQLKNPTSVAVSEQGMVYIADAGNNRVLEISSAGTASTLAKINGVLAVALDSAGNVVAADASQIWKVASDGSTASLIGGLTSPAAMVFASDGTLAIADTGANVIRELSTTGVLTAIAGIGTAGFSGDGGSALSAELNAPAGIALGADGAIWVADTGNNRIRSLTPVAVASETATVSIVNAASLTADSVAPGEIVTVFGTGFDPANTQLLFDGAPATLFYTSATQINAVAPATLTPGTNTTVSVVVDGAAMGGSSVAVVSAAPGIFTVAGGTGQAAANNQDGSLNSMSNPAARGSVVSLYATGQGSAATNVTISVGGSNAAILYAGPAPGFVGLMQINAQVPAGSATGTEPVVLTVSGVASQAGVTLAID